MSNIAIMTFLPSCSLWSFRCLRAPISAFGMAAAKTSSPVLAAMTRSEVGLELLLDILEAPETRSCSLVWL